VPTIGDALTKTVTAGIDSRRDSGKRYQILTILHDLLKNGKSKTPPETAWGTEYFLQNVLVGLFEKIARVAIQDSDRSVREEAKQLLEQLTGNSESQVPYSPT
jgi:hypothetical protein